MRNLDINQLRALIAIIDQGGVGRAAEVLHLTQGAVSIQIKRLEEILNQKILQKKGRGVELTVAGEALSRYARQILEINDRAYAHLSRGNDIQTIELGIPPDMAHPYLTEILREFSRVHPQVKLRTHFNNSVELRRMYNEGSLDFCITVDLQGQGHLVQECSVSWYYSGDTEATEIRPLTIATGDNPSARRMLSRVLGDANIAHEYLPGAADVLASASIVNAGLAVTVMVDRPSGHEPFFKVPCGLLPKIPIHNIYYDYDQSRTDNVCSDLAQITSRVFKDILHSEEPENETQQTIQP